MMRDFCSIVFVLPSAVNNTRHHAPVGSRVAPKLVRDQTPWSTTLPFQQLAEEALGRTPIAPWLDQDIDHVAVLVDCPPEILLAPVDVHEQFVQVPRVAQAFLPVPEDPGVRRTEPSTPRPNRFVGYGDAPLSEEIFSIAETQTEPVVEPGGVTDEGIGSRGN